MRQLSQKNTLCARLRKAALPSAPETQSLSDIPTLLAVSGAHAPSHHGHALSPSSVDDGDLSLSAWDEHAPGVIAGMTAMVRLSVSKLRIRFRDLGNQASDFMHGRPQPSWQLRDG